MKNMSKRKTIFTDGWGTIKIRDIEWRELGTNPEPIDFGNVKDFAPRGRSIVAAIIRHPHLFERNGNRQKNVIGWYYHTALQNDTYIVSIYNINGEWQMFKMLRGEDNAKNKLLEELENYG